MEELFQKVRKLGRRRVRYLLYRLRSEALGGGEAPELEKSEGVKLRELRKLVESQPGFSRWADFAANWDLPADKRLETDAHGRTAEVSIEWAGPVVVHRLRGEMQEWNAHLETAAKPLPAAEED